MYIAAVVLISILLATVLWLSVRIGKLRRLLDNMQKDQQLLSEAWRSEQEDLSAFLGASPRPVIAIQILNSVELAAKDSRFGRFFGNIAPDMIRKQVHKRTAASMRDQMTKNGVMVVVEVHGCD